MKSLPERLCDLKITMFHLLLEEASSGVWFIMKTIDKLYDLVMISHNPEDVFYS